MSISRRHTIAVIVAVAVPVAALGVQAVVDWSTDDGCGCLPDPLRVLDESPD